MKQHIVLEAILKKMGPEGAQLLDGIASDVSESVQEIDYFRKIAWLGPDASPTQVVELVEAELLGNLKYILYAQL